MTTTSKIISFLSGEWILLNGRPNGGDSVVFRTLWTGTILIFIISIIRSIDFDRCSSGNLLSGIFNHFTNLLQNNEGPLIYGAVYLAFYARFTSQWSYMANLYNQIKQTEVSTINSTINSNINTPLAQWKAAYIEDAFTTHTATKPVVAGVINAWYKDASVRKAFAEHTDNHQEITCWLIKNKVLEKVE